MTMNYWKDLHRISLQTASHNLWWRIKPILQMSASTGEMLARHRKLPGEAQHIAVLMLCMEQVMYDSTANAWHMGTFFWSAHYSPQIACLILVQDSWRDPDTPKQLGLRKVHGLHERSLHLDFLSKMFKPSRYKPLWPHDSHYAWSIFCFI